MKAKQEDKTPEEKKSGSKAVTNVLLVDILLRTGLRIGRRQIEKGLLRRNFSKQQARRIITGRPLSKSLISMVAARVAARSVPGAMLVGGGILAKFMFDAHKSAKKAKARNQPDTPAEEADA